ncbi:MAG: hypothetical protein EOO73_24930 [Myxococcales bacterium]|nr:MAG: hypothetical protein EOO73_24930 [Myxococcales bacterium]
MRKWLVLFSLAAASFGAAAGAQPGKKPVPSKEEDRAKSDAAKPGAKGEAASADKVAPPVEGAAPAGTDDLGAPPPKEVAEQKPEQKPSPLTPAPAEFPSGLAKPPPFEYDKLLGDIAALRSRVAALTTTLFASKLRVVVETKGEDARLASFNVTLDDGVVFSAPERFSADDERTVYEHAVAPGHHVVGVEIERYDARRKEFRTWQSSRFSVVIPESKLVATHLTIVDDSDMAEDFPDDADGQYDLRVKLRARVVE